MSQNNTTNLSCVFSAWVIPHMYTGGRRDRNTRQCRKTTQQTFPVCFLLGLYFTCTRVTPATVTPQCRKTTQQTFPVSSLHGLYPTCTGGGPHDRNTRQCRKTTQQFFPVSFLHGLYLTCTREDPSAAQQHNKPFLCLFCMGYISHVHGRTQQILLVYFLHYTSHIHGKPQQMFLVYFLGRLYLTCARQNPATVTSASVAKQDIKPFVCLFCMSYTSHVHGRTPRP